MLIYNQNKEFIGIDDEDLRLLGYPSLKDLLSRCSDIAELFVKRPGYIHDFKNFQWIDFVLHADADVSKAIIRTDTKEFSCDIVIRPFHLTQSPDEEAFAVSFLHIQPLGISSAADAIAKSHEPSAAPNVPKQPVHLTPETSVTPEPSPTLPDEPPVIHEPPVQLDVPDMLSTPTVKDEEVKSPDIQSKTTAQVVPPLDIEDDLFLEEEPTPEVPTPVEQSVDTSEPASAMTPQEEAVLERLQVPADYVFDPNVAADELGLPVDLIEEFIRDFIQQSHDFHDELFESAAKEDFENVKILSHKLKGVAANLRVEDAFEMLAIINGSHDQIEIETLLQTFYQTIARLEGKELPAAAPLQNSAAPETTDLDVAVETAPKPEAPGVDETPDLLPEDDIYAFDILDTTSARQTEPEDESQGLPMMEVPETEEELVIPPLDEEADTLMSEEKDIEVSKAKSETATGPDDDIYSFDLPGVVTLAEEAEDEEEDLGSFGADEEYELPPMDMTLLDEIASSQTTEAHPGLVLHYDAQKASDELGLDLALIQELQQDFADDANRLRSEIEAAISSRQDDKWRKSASQLKGIADNLRMEEIASKLQILTQTNDPKQAEKAMDELYTYVDQL